jgi:hypothetical protein
VLHGRRRLSNDGSAALRWALLGGVLAGFALLYRLDLVVAVGLGGLGAVWGASRRFQLRALAGLAVGAVGYLVHVVMAGPSVAFKGMVWQPVFDLRGGRRLPLPPAWDHLDGYLQKSGATVKSLWPLPDLTTSAQLSVWFFLLLAGVAFVVAVAIWSVRRDRARFEARVLLAVALFSLGTVPQALQRVDSAHFAWVTCVPFAFIPVAVLELGRARSQARRGAAYRLRAALSGGVVLLAVVLIVPTFTGWAYADYVAQTFGRHRTVFPINHDGRTFYYGRKDVADAANAMLADIPKVARPGDRLFVGTSDLRKTPVSDAYLYYLLPDFPPATYYIEMDPGVANAKGSRLASDLRSADIAILSGIWLDWDEPNDSRKLGPNEPNEVLAKRFCLVGSYGSYKGRALYQLLRKRPAGQPCPPGTTAPRPPGT